MTASNYVTCLDIKEGLNKAEMKNSSFKYIREFGILSLPEGRRISLETKDNEVALVILKGKCDIAIDGSDCKNLGSRTDVFSGNPTGIYIPIKKRYTITGHNAEIAVCASKCDKESVFAIISSNDIKENIVGKDNWKRQVRMIVGPSSPSVNLLVGETINPPGNWSGTPAHKHEKANPPKESLHEELYYFKVSKPQGFGIERIYSKEKDINELVYLKENTVTFMPYGYHQIVAGPGYTLYYLFFLSGRGKELIGSPDPEHTWITA